jgi:hypothetical protein
MAARFGADGYRERQIIEQHVSPPSGIDLTLLSPEELEQLASLLEKIELPPSNSSSTRADARQPAEKSVKTANSQNSVH